MLIVSGAFAQELKVYSEFSRIDPYGEVVLVDRPKRAGLKPREILSPAVARNAYASFHVAVTAPAGPPFTLYVGQNPEDAFTVSAYRELYAGHGGHWIPDRLEPVKLPYTTRLPDPPRTVRGQTTVTFWMDLRVPFNLEVGRYKVEPQVWIEGRWLVYPMEVRVLPATIPEARPAATRLALPGDASDLTARGPFLGFFCQVLPAAPADGRSTLRRHILRNALQDMALARLLAKKHGKEAVFPPPLRGPNYTGLKEWCREPTLPTDLGAEWYLRVRDALYRMID